MNITFSHLFLASLWLVILSPALGQSMVDEYNTTNQTLAYLFQCANSLASCMILDRYELWKNWLTGIDYFQTSHYIAAGCMNLNGRECSILCDHGCNCTTGAYDSVGDNFDPDGNNCSVIDTSPGWVTFPTAAPSGSPSFDYGEVIGYNGLGVQEDEIILFTCGDETSLASGKCTSVSFEDGWYWQNQIGFTGGCRHNYDNRSCIVGCSEHCTSCGIFNYDAWNNYTFNQSLPLTPLRECTLADDTMVPSVAPVYSESPVESVARRHSTTTVSGIIILVVVASVLGTAIA